MYNYFVHVITCTKSQLVHDIYNIATIFFVNDKKKLIANFYFYWC